MFRYPYTHIYNSSDPQIARTFCSHKIPWFHSTNSTS